MSIKYLVFLYNFFVLFVFLYISPFMFSFVLTSVVWNKFEIVSFCYLFVCCCSQLNLCYWLWFTLFLFTFCRLCFLFVSQFLKTITFTIIIWFACMCLDSIQNDYVCALKCLFDLCQHFVVRLAIRFSFWHRNKWYHHKSPKIHL